jgi:cysteine desulfurase
MASRIYFDHAATAPIDPRVAEVMETCRREVGGNPSSLHEEGRKARAMVERARGQTAALFNCEPGEIVFTASGTESDNLALTGVAEAAGVSGIHIITSVIEHPAILETCHYLACRGVAVTQLPVGSDGIVDPAELTHAFRPETRLVSIMAANNVVGTIQLLPELARLAHDHGALFHTDAVQAVGKIPLNTQKLPVDLLSLSAHKLHGPQGVGALFIRKDTNIGPLIHGGGQEQGLRSATENVAGIVGLGCAAELARTEMAAENVRLVGLRDRLINELTQAIPGVYLIGHPTRRLPGHICLGLAGLEGEAIKLLLALDETGVAISSGSACSTHHAGEPSQVLLAMGFDPVRARGSLRITLGRFNTEQEIERFLEILPKSVANLRSMTTRLAAAKL